MSRYIDADALIEHMQKRYKALLKEYGRYDHYTNGYGEATEVVDETPAADVDEVRHGYWQRWKNHPTIYGRDTVYVCSECTAKFLSESRYCAYCGAKMDGERREE